MVSSVWTGNEIIVYGGKNCISYNPFNNQVKNIPITYAEAIRRDSHLVWTGNEVILWGGEDDEGKKNTGVYLKKSKPTLGGSFMSDFFLFKKTN